MTPASTFLELRKHPRAQLKLPARVRWRGPLGMRMESTHTLDVSRNGIRVQRNESCESGSRLWVVFPFDAASAAGVPRETPARVVRVENCVTPSSPAPLSNPLAGMSAILTSVAVRWDFPTQA
jgi:hypothetical protein